MSQEQTRPLMASSGGSKFDWSERMSVGNSTLDDDHKAFFDIARMLSEASGAEDSDIIIDSALSILEEYVGGHFLREERALRAVNYPRLADHVLKHESFRTRVRAIADLYHQGTKSAADGLPEIVADWLRAHILSEDLQYKNWINDSAVDGRPLVYLAIESET